MGDNRPLPPGWIKQWDDNCELLPVLYFWPEQGQTSCKGDGTFGSSWQRTERSLRLQSTFPDGYAASKCSVMAGANWWTRGERADGGCASSPRRQAIFLRRYPRKSSSLDLGAPRRRARCEADADVRSAARSSANFERGQSRFAISAHWRSTVEPSAVSVTTTAAVRRVRRTATAGVRRRLRTTRSVCTLFSETSLHRNGHESVPLLLGSTN